MKHKNSGDFQQNSNSGGECKSEHSSSYNKFEIKYTEITDQLDKIFVLTLYTFHIDKLIDA